MIIDGLLARFVVDPRTQPVLKGLLKPAQPKPAKEGHRYRIRVDGSIHDNSGEGFAVYLNGRLLTEVKKGVTGWRRQGLRGSHVWQENIDDLKAGKVTIAVANFPMNNWDRERYIPAIRPLTVLLEEQKLPPVAP